MRQLNFCGDIRHCHRLTGGLRKLKRCRRQQTAGDLSEVPRTRRGSRAMASLTSSIQAVTGATTPASPPASFLGRHIEIAIVTPDAYKTMAGLHRLGIGPWRVYTFSPENTSNQTFRGQPSPFELRVCFAEGEGGVIWELMQPLSGRTIFQEFLDAHGASGGIQHLAFDCNNIPFAERVAGFEQRGFKMVQGGSWMGRNHFAFFETEEATTTCFETYEFPADWEYPEPEAWYPARS